MQDIQKMASNIIVTLPDGSKREYQKGTTCMDVAISISEGLARAVVAAKVDDKIVDLSHSLQKDCSFKLLKAEDKEGLEVFRHSSAHLLANAVMELFPDAKLTIGPVVEEGFYYDIDHAPFSPEDIEKIEKKMQEIVDKKIDIKKRILTKKDALELFKDNEYKLEIINDIPADEEITAYQQGEFIDLCSGPHIPNTKMIKAFKITKTSGAYWRGDAKNKSLQRLYGISFTDKKFLNEYLQRIEEASKRDHRKLGKELELFTFSQLSPGSPFFLPNGATMYNTLVNFIREEYKKRDYKEVITPQLFHKDLWIISGHWEHYSEYMFHTQVEGQTFSLKPMNCPSHLLIYTEKNRSYRDLPLRIADFCCIHRNELSGTLSGLTRVRKFSQDDAHVFCTMEQIEDEVKRQLEFIRYVWSEVFNFELDYYLSTRPEKYLGNAAIWVMAEKGLANALEKSGIKYSIKEKDGAFYGPKIDIEIKDALGRKWQCPTVQLDFNLPERFNAKYEGQDGKKHPVVMIHRAVLGSLERFMGLLIEHMAGKFPLWLNPVQAIILTVADRHIEFAEELRKKMINNGIRVELDTRAETIPKKVREAQLSQINYILVVGDKELENKTVNVRTRDNIVHGEKKVDGFISDVLNEIKSKKI